MPVMSANRPLVRIILIALLVALSGPLLAVPARADNEEAFHIYDLARQLHTEDLDDGNYTAWVNGDMGKDETGRPGKLSVGHPMPDFQFKNFDKDGELTRKTLTGPYILNFWASWCGPCRDEYPLLTDKMDSGDLDIPVYFVNVFDTKRDAERFLSNFQQEVTIVVDSGDSAFAARYRIAAIPQTILVDADGNIQALHSGGMTEYSVEFFNEIAHHPGIGGFDARDPDQPPENMVTDAGKTTLSRAN